MEAMAVIDFETTGISPNMGDRVTEVAIVLVEGGKIVDQYQSLVNAKVHIPYFIEELTGITNAMIQSAPPPAKVLREMIHFLGDLPLVAHNASFDSKFLDAELALINEERRQEFACSMLLARRLYPGSPNYQLGSLVRHLKLPDAKRHHRALADAQMTAHLLIKLMSDIKDKYNLELVSHKLLRLIQKAPKAKVQSCIEKATKAKTSRVAKPCRSPASHSCNNTLQ